ncbi:hypothetical protein PVV74_03110 [Roseovarius sp. SK2]|jgi:hypothetical protein|uniref:hypothetical protein n=2 Tax=Roseovarius TaxID=74030 RepID=UPI000CDCFEA5|nr:MULTISPECIES: hypothetical protein [unclassified Roseovarius]MDD9724438.1 hypothetical protein [Roseovarius sp. SK2]
MTFMRSPQEVRLEKRQAKGKTARKWARGVQVCLMGLCMTAIWQERALYPVMHDRMQGVYAYGVDWLESTETGSGYLTAMSDLGSGNASEHSAITRALMNLRQ